MPDSNPHQQAIGKQFQQLVEFAPMAMVMVNHEGQIVYVNAETERLFGYDREELQGQQIELLVPARLRAVHPGHRAIYCKNPTPRRMGEGRELYARRKDGSEFPVEIGLNPVRSEEGSFVVSAIADITERKKLEEVQQQINEELKLKNDQLIEANNALAEKSRLLESVVESIGEGLVAVDKAGKFVVFNSEARRLLGVHEVTGDIWSNTYDLFYEDQTKPVPPAQLPLARALQGEEIDDLILFVRNKTVNSEAAPDGTFIHISARPRLSHAGEIEGAVAAIRDITRIKNVEEELRIRNDEMEQFVYTVSHDLKAPLVTSKGFIGLMREDLDDGNFEDVLDSMMRIENAANKMSSLIDDLLRLSRVGRLKNDPQPIDTTSMVKRLKDFYFQPIEEQQIEFVVQEDMPVVNGDPSAIERVFENLIGNAIKYGGKQPGARIETGAIRTDDEIRFFVKDNGPGIDPQYHEKIFGIFQRLDSDEEGTGIGLAIATKIVNVHGGNIWVTSESGKGATFWVALPRDLEVTRPSFAQ